MRWLFSTALYLPSFLNYFISQKLSPRLQIIFIRWNVHKLDNFVFFAFFLIQAAAENGGAGKGRGRPPKKRGAEEESNGTPAAKKAKGKKVIITVTEGEYSAPSR